MLTQDNYDESLLLDSEFIRWQLTISHTPWQLQLLSMATFLFWNINGKSLGDSVARLVERHQVDVLMLAESPLSGNAMLAELNRDGGNWEFAPSITPPDKARTQVYTRMGSRHMRERHASEHTTIREVEWPNLPSMLLAVVHLPSKLWNDQDDQRTVCNDLSELLRDAESNVGHQRTVVVGDFNVNPFESGMLAPECLNAQSSRHVASTVSRRIGRRHHPFFYNPMWNFFGDQSRGPGGTYYYSGSKKVRLSWNILDQVLVRPALLSGFDTSELEILTTDGRNPLLNQEGFPDKRNFSDHLPILFRLTL